MILFSPFLHHLSYYFDIHISKNIRHYFNNSFIFQTPTEIKKRDKKRKKSKGGGDDKSSVKSVTPVPELVIPTNLSTEESGYESDLTRRGSDKGSDSSLSNSPLSNRSLKLESEDAIASSDGGSNASKEVTNNEAKETETCSDLEQQDLSLDSITTTNETTLLLEHNKPTKLSDLVDHINDAVDDLKKSKSLLNFPLNNLTSCNQQSASLTNLNKLSPNSEIKSDCSDDGHSVSLIDINFNQTDEEKMRRSGKSSVNTMTTHNTNNNNNDDKSRLDNSNCEKCENNILDDTSNIDQEINCTKKASVDKNDTLEIIANSERQNSATMILSNLDNLSADMSNALTCSNCSLTTSDDKTTTLNSLHSDQQQGHSMRCCDGVGLNKQQQQQIDVNQLFIEDLEEKVSKSLDDLNIDDTDFIESSLDNIAHVTLDDIDSNEAKSSTAIDDSCEYTTASLVGSPQCTQTTSTTDNDTPADNANGVEADGMHKDAAASTTNLEITNLRDTKTLQIHKLPESSKTRQRFIIEGMVEGGGQPLKVGGGISEGEIKEDMEQDNPSSESNASTQINHPQPCDNITSLSVEWEFNNFQSLPCTSLEATTTYSTSDASNHGHVDEDMVDHRDSVSGADIKINDNPKSQLEQQQLQVRRVIHKTSKDY